MYRTAFPKCTVTGSLQPVPFSHMGTGKAIPEKCSQCRWMFEGGCLRNSESIEGFLSLDHGSCPIQGDTRPVLFSNQFIQSKVSVPAKCTTCRDLHYDPIAGFTCHFEYEIWGWPGRTLDWGVWEPDLPNIGLVRGRMISRNLIESANTGSEAVFIKAIRLEFPELSIREARDTYLEVCKRLSNL